MKKLFVLIVYLLFVMGNLFAIGLEDSLITVQSANLLEDSSIDSLKPINTLGHYPDPKVTVRLGINFIINDAVIGVNTNTNIQGTRINLSQDLGFIERFLTPAVGVFVRLGKRHQVYAGGFGYSMINRRILQRNIRFEDTTFFANGDVTSRLRFAEIDASYRFSIYRSPRGEAGIGLGIKFFDIYASITANLNQFSYSRNKSIIAPTPAPCIHGAFYPIKRLLLRGNGEYFKLGFEKTDYQVWGAQFSIEYFPFEHWGIGGVYSYGNIRVHLLPYGEDFNGNVSYSFHIASLVLTGRF